MDQQAALRWVQRGIGGFGLPGPRQQLAQAMQQDWTNFAKAVVPASGWPGFTASDQRALSLVPPRPQLETDYAAEHRCSFWSTA
jgi:para-nitrobenzyl esterase